jgi:3-(3-hydroxy-phenyl)propionate hydroxylase
MSRNFRNAVLDLAREHPFARKLVNSGRLSMPSFLVRSALNTADSDTFAGDMVPGAPMDDAPVGANGQPAWLLDQCGGNFQCLVYVAKAGQIDAATRATLDALATGSIPVKPLVVCGEAGDAQGLPTVVDVEGKVAKRYDLQPGTTYLLRPDQHVAARWRRLDAAAVQAALARATCNATA